MIDNNDNNHTMKKEMKKNNKTILLMTLSILFLFSMSFLALANTTQEETVLSTISNTSLNESVLNGSVAEIDSVANLSNEQKYNITLQPDGNYSETFYSAKAVYDSLIADKTELEELNLSTVRYGDLLLIAQSELERIAVQEIQYYNASDEEESVSKPTYDVLYDRLEELATLKSLALQTRDEFVVLEDFLKENNYLEDNATYNSYIQANESFHAERYEEAMVHIEAAREKASEYDALNTKVKALVAASSRNVKSFLQRNWEYVLLGLVSALVLFFVLKKIIRRALIKRKIHQLNLRKESVHELTKQIQHDYFTTGKLSESAYHIRLKVYGEMVRNIRRQIPLLEEELVLQKNIFGKRKKSPSEEAAKEKKKFVQQKKQKEHKTSHHHKKAVHNTTNSDDKHKSDQHNESEKSSRNKQHTKK